SMDTNFSCNKYIRSGGNDKWYQYIIPLDEFKRKSSDLATFTDIQYARIWFKGFTDTAQIKIVDISLVGNQWIKSNKNDTTYTVSDVNIRSEEHTSELQSPE